MTDRELMQQALDSLEGYARNCRCEGNGGLCDAGKALRARLAQPEPEPVATLFGSLPVYDTPTQPEPVAWVENLDNARPHCVTDLRYCSVMQYERGEHLKYIPLYLDPTPCKTCEALARTVMMDQTSHDTAPPQREWQGLTDEEMFRLWVKCPAETEDRFAFGRAVEAKLKEKNT